MSRLIIVFAMSFTLFGCGSLPLYQEPSEGAKVTFVASARDSFAVFVGKECMDWNVAGNGIVSFAGSSPKTDAYYLSEKTVLVPAGQPVIIQARYDATYSNGSVWCYAPAGTVLTPGHEYRARALERSIIYNENIVGKTEQSGCYLSLTDLTENKPAEIARVEGCTKRDGER